jgi:hypothetical protein
MRSTGERVRTLDRLAITLLGLLVVGGTLLRILLTRAQVPGFMTASDSSWYLIAAHVNVFVWAVEQGGNPWPAGYPAFLALLYGIDDHLSFIAVVQHVFGVCTAVLWFLTVRRVAPALWGLLPAAVVLFAGPQLFLEHAPMAETPFAFLIAGVAYCAVRAADERPAVWGALAGLLAASAACVRVIGLPLVLLVAAWMLVGVGGGVRQRLTGAVAVVLAAGLVFGVYLVEMKREAGFGGPLLTRSGNWNGPAPGTGKLVGASYLNRVGHDLTRYWSSDDLGVTGGYNYDGLVGLLTQSKLLHFPDSAYTYRYLTEPGLRTNRVTDWYATGRKSVRTGLLTAMLGYERHTRIEGLPFVALVLLMLAGIPLARGARLAAGVLVAAIAAATLLVPLLFLYFDARYVVPGYGPLAAAAAIGAASLWERVVVPRRRRRERTRASGLTRREVPEPAQAGR